MGIPTLNINFRQAARKTVLKLSRGMVALIIKDTVEGLAGKVLELSSVSDIPRTLTASNVAYIERAFIGNTEKPKRVYVAVIGADGSCKDGLTVLAKYKWDWLAATPECAAADASAVVDWIETSRGTGSIYKAVLPDKEANNSAIVNFAATGITTENANFTTAEYCSRIAGLIAGTSIAQSVTYAPLPEVIDIDRMTDEEMNNAVNAGKLILMHDGEKVKTVSGVTSLANSSGKNNPLQKIKTVEVLDAIRRDLTTLAQDEYLGKMQNTYDNKCSLMVAIKDYLKTLEAEDVITTGSTVEIDADAQRKWLKEQGIDVSDMDEDAIKRANTGSHVFIRIQISIYDVIETINLDVTFDMGA